MKKNNKFREKLFKKTDFPKIKTIPKNLNKSWGKGKFVMPSPLEVNTLMKKVPKGKLTTINEIRKKLAKKYKTTTACPIVTGIFSWIAAGAAYIDLIVCSIVVVIGFIGTKIILFDLLDGTFNKEFNDIGIVMVTVFILSTVVFGIQIPKTIKELKNN